MNDCPFSGYTTEDFLWFIKKLSNLYMQVYYFADKPPSIKRPFGDLIRELEDIIKESIETKTIAG